MRRVEIAQSGESDPRRQHLTKKEGFPALLVGEPVHLNQMPRHEHQPYAVYSKLGHVVPESLATNIADKRCAPVKSKARQSKIPRYGGRATLIDPQRFRRYSKPLASIQGGIIR